MKIEGDIITVGLAPAWDLTCHGQGLNWGDHPVLEAQSMAAAGKALNISRALAWLGQASTAAGWWGQDDFQQMERHLTQTAPQIRMRLTPAPGRTRVNVTVLDRKDRRELHLRAVSSLASPSALSALQQDLHRVTRRNSVTVLAGALPGGPLRDRILALVRAGQHQPSTRLVVDAHGPVFQALVSTGLPWLIKPNVAELCELMGTTIPDRIPSLVRAGQRLADRVPHVLISRGNRGVVLVTPEGAWEGHCLDRGRVVSTVGCGDYLLAGFLYGLTRSARIRTALTTALKVATARAWGWTHARTWAKTKREIQIAVRPL
jgi:1-phosphofructokinase family hexose kinase